MSGSGNGGGAANQNPLDRATSCLSLIMAFAIAFVFTPLIHGNTVQWALAYMSIHYGAWMVWIGWYLWWVIIALLTFFVSNLLIMLALMLGPFLMMTFKNGRR